MGFIHLPRFSDIGRKLEAGRETYYALTRNPDTPSDVSSGLPHWNARRFDPSSRTGLRDAAISRYVNLALLGCLTIFAFVVMGYHPGLEDDSFYLAAIKRDLNPSLFPHDADFFRLQFQATIFDKLIAFSVRDHPHTCRVDGRCVANRRGFLRTPRLLADRSPAALPGRRLIGLPRLLIAALLTLPVSGIAINLADQYLHPRTLATAAILAAIVAVLDRRLWTAGFLLAFAFSVHAIMASFGISFCVFLWWPLRSKATRRLSMPAAALVIPLGWLFEPASDAWRQAAATRGFYFLGRWHWYEWLGVFAPLHCSSASVIF